MKMFKQSKCNKHFSRIAEISLIISFTMTSEGRKMISSYLLNGHLIKQAKTAGIFLNRDLFWQGHQN